MAVTGRVVVYGGKGALGAACVSKFKSKNWWVGSIDMKSNDEADANIIVDADAGLVEQGEKVLQQVKEVLKGEKVEGVICVAGGWAGGNAANACYLKNCDLMLKQSAWTSLIAAQVAALHLKEHGFVVLTGAQSALEGTPSMVGYGAAKGLVHQLALSLGTPGSGIPHSAWVGAILPVTLDTPMNRKVMSKAGPGTMATWTPLEFVTDLFWKWASSEKERPESKKLLQVVTYENVSKVVPAIIHINEPMQVFAKNTKMDQ